MHRQIEWTPVGGEVGRGGGAEGQQSLFVLRKKYCSTRLNNAALGAYLAQQQEGRRLISSCLLVSLCLSVSLSLSRIRILAEVIFVHSI